MNKIDGKHIAALAQQVIDLIAGNEFEIIEAFNASAAENSGEREVRLSMSAHLQEIGPGKYESKCKLTFHHTTVKADSVAVIDDKQLRLPTTA